MAKFEFPKSNTNVCMKHAHRTVLLSINCTVIRNMLFVLDRTIYLKDMNIPQGDYKLKFNKATLKGTAEDTVTYVWASIESKDVYNQLWTYCGTREVVYGKYVNVVKSLGVIIKNDNANWIRAVCYVIESRSTHNNRENGWVKVTNNFLQYVNNAYNIDKEIKVYINNRKLLVYLKSLWKKGYIQIKEDSNKTKNVIFTPKGLARYHSSKAIGR